MGESAPPPRRQKIQPGIYVRTTPAGKVVYEIGWRDAQGIQRWRRVDGGIRAARTALAEAHAARGRGERTAANPRLRFNEAADAWWEQRVAQLRPTTQATYSASLKHLRSAFGNRRLADISASDVAAFIARQRQAGFKAWSIKGHVSALRGVFDYASRHLGHVGSNPVTLLDHVERPKVDDEKPKRILSDAELRRLLDAVDRHYRLLFELAAQTGGRLGEVLGLTWGDIDLEAGTVTFAAQLDRHGQRVPLKTKRSRRCLEITPSLTAGLREAKVAAFDTGKHALVFTSRMGTAHDHRNIGGRVMARAVRRAGLGPIERDGQVVEPAPTFHSLRHSHGSALIASGWDLEEVSARLGHSDTGTTSRTYVHAFDAARRSDMRRRRLDALYEREPDSDSSKGGDLVGLKRE